MPLASAKDKSDQTDSVYSSLRRQILTLSLAPGEMLSENALAAQLGVSRPIVREALTRLSEDGCIVVYPQRGSVVTTLSPERIRQSVSTHIILETSVIEEVCRMELSQEQLSGFSEQVLALRELARGNDIYAFIKRELELHRTLAVICGRAYAWEVFRCMDCDLVRLNYLLYSTFTYKVDMSSLTGRENTVTEARMMMDNIVRGDSEAAALICTNHFNNLAWNTETLRRIYPKFFSGQE